MLSLLNNLRKNITMMKRKNICKVVLCGIPLMMLCGCNLFTGEKSGDSSVVSATEINESEQVQSVEVRSVYDGRWLSSPVETTIGYKKTMISRPEVTFNSDGTGSLGFAFSMTTQIDDNSSYVVRGSALADTKWEERSDTLLIIPNTDTFATIFDEKNPLTIKTNNETERDALLADRQSILERCASLLKDNLIGQLPREVRWTHIEIVGDKMSVINRSGIKITYHLQP